MSGWIKLRRSLIDWEWYDNHNATRLLIHLLLSVNYKDKKWHGKTIKAGTMVLSWETLSNSIGLTIQKCRTAMDKLESSGEVTRETTNKYQTVTLVKWDKIQVLDEAPNNQITIKQQSNNNQITTTKEHKERKEHKNHIPTWIEFLSFAELKTQEYNLNISEVDLKMKYDSWIENGWMTNNKPPRKIKNWKTTTINTLKYLNTPNKLNNKSDEKTIELAIEEANRNLLKENEG